MDQGQGSERIRRDALEDTEVGGRSSALATRVVDLADEFHLTTAEALDVCARAGIPVAHGGHELDAAAAQRFRDIAQLPVPTIEEVGAAASWAVPPPNAGLEPPPPLPTPAPFVPLRIGDAAVPRSAPPVWDQGPSASEVAASRRWRLRWAPFPRSRDRGAAGPEDSPQP